LHDKVTTLHWLDAFSKELNDLRRIIYESDPAVVTAVFEHAGTERAKWLLKREDNEWDEKGQKIEHMSMMGHLFGGMATGRDKNAD
jgi:hypothetical protein